LLLRCFAAFAWGLLETYNFTGTLNGLAFLDKTIGSEEHNTNLASFQIHAHALDARSEPILMESDLVDRGR
jgi:hypothetical protein